MTKLGAALSADGQTDTARRCWHDALAILEALAIARAAEARTLLEKFNTAESNQYAAETPGRSPAEHH